VWNLKSKVSESYFAEAKMKSASGHGGRKGVVLPLSLSPSLFIFLCGLLRHSILLLTYSHLSLSPREDKTNFCCLVHRRLINSVTI
jgi:hypothetical protein